MSDLSISTNKSHVMTEDTVVARPAWKSYLYIARVDHWFKQIFLLTGSALAVLLADIPIAEAVGPHPCRPDQRELARVGELHHQRIPGCRI